MGNTESTPANTTPKTPPTSVQDGCPVKTKPESEGCPVKSTTVEPEGCPVKYRNPNQYNVYSQKIDPTNQMPAKPMQSAAPSQSQDLSVERVTSGIPKGGTDTDTWYDLIYIALWHGLNLLILGPTLPLKCFGML